MFDLLSVIPESDVSTARCFLCHPQVMCPEKFFRFILQKAVKSKVLGSVLVFPLTCFVQDGRCEQIFICETEQPKLAELEVPYRNVVNEGRAMVCD